MVDMEHCREVFNRYCQVFPSSSSSSSSSSSEEGVYLIPYSRLKAAVLAGTGQTVSAPALRHSLSQLWKTSKFMAHEDGVDFLCFCAVVEEVLQRGGGLPTRQTFYSLLDCRNKGYVTQDDLFFTFQAIAPCYAKSHSQDLFAVLDVHGLGQVDPLLPCPLLHTI
eukprot:scaffold1463_cov189-Ochromonas_danica.AAC.10